MDRYSTVNLKGQLNKEYLADYCENLWKNEDVFHHFAPFLGVKFCPQKYCKYSVYISFQFLTEVFVLNTVNLWKSPSTQYPVEFVYIRPKANTGNRRWWITGLVCCQKDLLII